MSHRPFIGVVVSFGLGVFWAILGPLSFRLLWFPAVVFLFLTASFFHRYQWSIILLFLCFLCLGGMYTVSYRTLWKNDINVIGRYYSGKSVVFEGLVVSDVTQREFFKGRKLTFELQVNELKGAEFYRTRKARGRVLVNLFCGKEPIILSYGDAVVIEGKLHRPFNFGTDQKFSYRDYLARKGIQWILSVKKNGRLEVSGHHRANPLKDFAMRSRHHLQGILDEHLSFHESAFMQALLLGNRTQIPKPLEELFLHTGTAHILAISGMNIAIVAAFILLCLKLLPVPRSVQLCLTIVLLFFYMILTGAPPSVVRASIMAIVLLSSFLVERETEIFNSLAFAAFLILLMNPMNLLDVGCQLSFISVWAIIILSPAVLKKLDGFLVFARPLPKFLCEGIAVSTSAWIGVAGLIAFYFQIVTPVTVLANLLIVSLMTLIVFLGLGLLLAGLISPFLSFTFAACIKVAINIMILIVYLMDRIPGAYFNLPPLSWKGVLAYYAFLFLILIYFHYCRNRIFEKTPQR